MRFWPPTVSLCADPLRVGCVGGGVGWASGTPRSSHTRLVRDLGRLRRRDRFSGSFAPAPESPDVRPPEWLESRVPSSSMACCKLLRDLYRTLNSGGEALFCLSSCLPPRWLCWLCLMYNPGVVVAAALLSLSLRLVRFSAFGAAALCCSCWNFFPGMVSIGGGSGGGGDKETCPGAEVGDTGGDASGVAGVIGVCCCEESANGDRMLLGNGAKPRT